MALITCPIRWAIIALLSVVSVAAHAGHLTVAQLQALKADINANFLAEWNAQNIDAIVAAYNAIASPAFTVWRANVPASEYRESITWTEYTGRSQGERDMFSFLSRNGTSALDCTKQNVRQAIQDAFSGASGVNSRTALIAGCKRTITRGERIYAIGTGTNLSPGSVGPEGAFDASDIIGAMGQ